LVNSSFVACEAQRGAIFLPKNLILYEELDSGLCSSPHFIRGQTMIFQVEGEGKTALASE
jgi:hypothetical protein